MSNLLDDVIICCDDKKIMDIAKNLIQNQFSHQKNKNGTERIYEAYKKIKKYDLIIDIRMSLNKSNPY